MPGGGCPAAYAYPAMYRVDGAPMKTRATYLRNSKQNMPSACKHSALRLSMFV
jgi:hypothetical protein